ncbi:MAG TPA: type II toxin-antitoxin system RelE/ParE family toxin [Gemmatimonadaceae bacterium]|nr:type II toxin-antitoxin system RelE/ParE family toxin [Gemmatimonadaceae bacterium]
MSPRRRVIWLPLAVQRVTHIAHHIARDRPRAASQWVDEVFAAVTPLGQFPESGRVVPEVGRDDIRELFHGEYRIISKVEARRVAVLTVRHGRRRFRLEGEPPPEAPAAKPPQN